MTVIQYSHYSQVNSSSDKATAKKAVKSEADATEIDEENDTKEYQCYYCGLMIVSVRNVKDHMREKHRRFHSKVSKPFLRLLLCAFIVLTYVSGFILLTGFICYSSEL